MMRKPKLYKQKFRGTFLSLIILSSLFITLSFMLVPPTESESWYIGWFFRKQIVIHPTNLGADLMNFPVLIDIVDNDLRNKAQVDGDDIVFTDAGGTAKLGHEIELYDSVSGHLVAWVKIPLLSSSTATDLYMYYGNPDAANQQNPSAVWDSNYVMVQHLNDASGMRYDSTGNNNNATVYGGVSKTVGKIGTADKFDGTSGYLKVPAGFLPTTAITVEFWLKPSSTATYWMKHINTGPGTTIGIYGGVPAFNYDGWSLTFSWNNKAKTFSTGAQPSGFNWIHLAVTWNGSYCYAYYNGVKINEGPLTAIQPDWAGMALILGANYGGYENFKGSMDEIRVSNIAHTSAWIKASYTNQKDPSTFYTIGTEETIPAAPAVFSPSPTNNVANVSPNLSELSFNLMDYQGNPMNYTVVTDPYIGSDIGVNVNNGRFTVSVTNLQKLTTYKWNISVTDGTHWTNVTYKFTTLPSNPPYYEGDPILTIGGTGQLICYNSTTHDLDGDKVTNIYNWYRNGISITNLLLPFDTNSSTIAKDYSGYNNNGQILRGVTWTPNGKVGGAYNFQKGLIQIPGTNALDGGGAWSEITVEHWIYLTASQTGTRTIARIPSYEIGITWGNRIFAGIWVATGNPMVSGYNRVTYDTPLNTNTWYHVALTYKSGAYLTLYINGVAVATSSRTISGNIQPSGSFPLYIGWFNYFRGMVDEVRIYSRCLSPQQIYQRYLDTKAGSTSSSTIVSAEIIAGDVWRCEVTPNDSYVDGATRSSNTISG